MDTYFPSPHLISVRASWDDRDVYMRGLGVAESDLTDSEKAILKDSLKYLLQHNKKEQ